MAVSLTAIVSLDKTGFASGLSGMSQLVSNVTGAMSMAFGGVASEIIAMSRAFGPVGGAVAALKEAVTVGASFEQQIANVSSVSGLMGEELKKVEIAARDLAKTTRFTATEAGDALYSLASAGITGADALSNTLKPALLLAGATLSSTQMATEAVTAALANFQIPAAEAGRIADQFAGAIATSPATMERLSDAMKYAGPAAAGFGIELEKTVAEVAALHQVGLRGEMAGTSFRMALIQLSKAAADTSTTIGEALEDWDASTEGVTGAVRRLNKAGVDTADVIQALGARAGPGMAALMKFGADAMDELAKRITNAADVSKMYDTQMATLSGRFAIFKSAVEEVWLKLSGALAPSMTALAKNATAAIDWIGKLADALIAGNWQAAGDQIKSLWGAIREGAQAFDWMGLFDSMADILDGLIGRVASFGETIMQQIGLTQTLYALRGAFETVQEVIGRLMGRAKNMAGYFRDVKWADVAKAAINALDIALATVIATIEDVIKGVAALVDGWKNLSVEAKAVALAITGSAGLVVGLVQLVSAIKAITTATAATAVAMKANLISHAETAYIKLLLLVDAIKAVTLAQAGMVAGAAALGVGLGLLIRQIPGVAEALDNAAIAMGKFLGLVETEDQQLKRRAAELKRQRQEQLAAMAAQEAATEALRKAAVVTADMTDAENERLVAMQLAQDAADAQVNAIEAMQGAVDEYIPAAADMTDAENERVVAMQLAQDATDAAANKAESAAIAQNKLADGTRNVKSEMVGLLPAIDNFKKSGIGAFDLSKFTLALKQLEMGLKGIAFADIELPDLSTLALPKITQYDVSQFLMGIKRLELGLRGVDLGVIGKLFGLDKVAPGLGGGKTGTRTLDDIYNLLAGARGVVWA